MMAATTSDFDRNSSRSNSEMRPVAEKVATTTWRDEPAPAYAKRGEAARARRGRIGGFSETNFTDDPQQRKRATMSTTNSLRIHRETPAYWRVVFDYPPFNVLDGTVFQALQDLLGQIEANSALRAVVFESANADFFLSHFDLTGKLGNVMSAVGPTGLPILFDTFVRISKSPVAMIAKIRGCVRGACSEFVLACDMRFASRENTRLGQPEVGVGLHPGGGGTERLPHLVGRGRALEIILGASDFDGETAERYGYVNRALPDAELDAFVDTLARRISSFDKRSIAAAKRLVNEISLPPAERFLDAFNSFGTALSWPETQTKVGELLKRGLQTNTEFEKRWPEVLDTL